MKSIAIMMAFVTVIAINGCTKDKWEGFVYPDKNDLTMHAGIGEFKSLESCRDACLSILDGFNATHKGDYECGKNCRDDGRFSSLKVCEETTK